MAWPRGTRQALASLLLLLVVSASDAEARQQLQQNTDAAASVERLAITYLVPKHHNSSSFRKGEDSFTKLRDSLMHLFRNVLPWQQPDRVDVLLFHTGDYTDSDIKPLLQAAEQGASKSAGPHKDHVLQRLQNNQGNNSLLQLVHLSRQHWRLPIGLHHSDVEGWQHPAAKQYTYGYLNMLRFYGILVFKLTQSMGYAWTMRLDDDSSILSPMQYDIVDRMQSNNYDYGWRVSQSEGSSFTRGFPEALHLYIAMHEVQPTFLYEHCNPPSLAGLNGTGWDSFAYYNNWFIARNRLFTADKAAHFLAFLDRIGGIYTQRWGDALIHAALVQMFLDKQRVHEFTDFHYKHNWMDAPRNNRVHWGVEVKLTPVE